MDAQTPESQAPLALREVFLLAKDYGERHGASRASLDATSYRQLYSAALDGRFRTVVLNGRHYGYRSDVPKAASVLGLTAAHEFIAA
jgi:hypothetical protein